MNIIFAFVFGIVTVTGDVHEYRDFYGSRADCINAAIELQIDHPGEVAFIACVPTTATKFAEEAKG